MELESAPADDAIPRAEVDHFCSLLIDGLQVRSDPAPTPGCHMNPRAALPACCLGPAPTPLQRLQLVKSAGVSPAGMSCPEKPIKHSELA